MNSGKATKRPPRSSRNFRESEIKLHHFIAFALAHIADIGLHAKRGAGGQLCGRELQIAVTELRVAQPISEGIQGLAVEVAVGTIRHRIIFKWWQLLDSLVEGNRQ